MHFPAREKIIQDESFTWMGSGKQTFFCTLTLSYIINMNEIFFVDTQDVLIWLQTFRSVPQPSSVH